MRDHMTQSGSDWGSLLQTGLLGGFIVLFLALVGIVQASHNRVVVAGVVSLGQTLLIITYVLMCYSAAGRARSASQAGNGIGPVVAGAVTGFLMSLVLVLLLVVGGPVNLRAVFVNASPALFAILRLGLSTPAGEILLLVVGVAIGALTGALFLLSPQVRRAVIIGLGMIPAISVLNSALFAGRGLSIIAAAIVFLAAGGARYTWGSQQSAVMQRVKVLPPAHRRSLQIGIWALATGVILLLPLLGSYPSEVLNNVGLYVLMGLGLNIVVGFAGLLDLGYVAFYALGAYAIGILTSPEIGWIGLRLTFWEALPLAVLVATLAGVVLGVPVLGMRGDYLAIVTLGFGEIIRIVVLSDWLKPFIGGSNGITRVPRPALVPLVLDNPQKLYYLILLGCVLAAFIANRAKYSRLGRNWMAVREDEDVAQAMGIDLIRAKLLAFATGAAFAGMSGAIFGAKLGSMYPHSFNVMVSINVLSLVIVGGLGSIPGVVVGALALVGLPELLREFAEYRLLVYGAALVFMMLRRPEGLWPEARRRLELHEEREAGG